MQTSDIRHDEVKRTRRMAYDAFIEHAATYFGRDHRSIVRVADIAWTKLQDVPEESWTQLKDAVVHLWERWPLNLVTAIRQAIADAKICSKQQHKKTHCRYCNGSGYFLVQYHHLETSGVPYSSVWRCAGCRNWAGILGEAIPAAYPLELKSRGFEIVVPPSRAA